MTDFSKPRPIINEREHERFSELTEEYKEFRSPNFAGKQVNTAKQGLVKAGRKLKKWTPGLSSAQEGMKDLAKKASRQSVVKDALSKAGKGIGLGLNWCAQETLSRQSILNRLRSDELKVNKFEHICLNRSYEIAPLTEKDWKNRTSAALQGFGTGMLGGIGLPLNLALSTVLFLRATQRVALHFGYDAIGREREQMIAADVTLKSLQPSEGPPSGSAGGILGKMMMASEVSALTKALGKKTYQEMAKAGGSQLLYTKLRATANKAAKKALGEAGKEGFETTLVRRLLQDFGERLPKRAGQRVVPVIGGLIGGSFDTWQMNQVIRGANLFYHKRFIAEKVARVERLGDSTE
jgi:hypothetical protein